MELVGVEKLSEVNMREFIEGVEFDILGGYC
jgi:hypothetical protein